MPPENERRSDDKKIENLQLAVARIEANIVAVKDAREVSQKATEDFRRELKESLVLINVKLASLPCEARDVTLNVLNGDITSETRNREAADIVLHKRVNQVWGILVTVFLLVLGSIGAVAWAGGSRISHIQTTVDRNTVLIMEKIPAQIEKLADLFHSHETKDDRRMGQ